MQNQFSEEKKCSPGVARCWAQAQQLCSVFTVQAGLGRLGEAVCNLLNLFFVTQQKGSTMRVQRSASNHCLIASFRRKNARKAAAPLEHFFFFFSPTHHNPGEQYRYS